MSLFDEYINALNDFRYNQRITETFPGFSILTRTEFIKWFRPIPHLRSMADSSFDEANKQLIEELFHVVCGSRIQKTYLSDTASHVFTRDRQTDDDNFDLLICVKTDVLRMKRPSQDEKKTGVIAFIVSELGECQIKPYTMSVNLICSRATTGFKGNVLLAAMMCCVKASRYDKEVILELAGHYFNMGGFKSYSRVGFDRDKRLYGPDCFDDTDNLPMSVRVDNLSYEQIISYAIENRQSHEIQEELGRHFYTMPRLMNANTATQIGEIAHFYHLLDINIEPNDIETYNDIVRGLKSKKQKKQKLLETVISLTPRTTPVQMSRAKSRASNERVTDTLHRTKKKLNKKGKGKGKGKKRRSTSRGRITKREMDLGL